MIAVALAPATSGGFTTNPVVADVDVNNFESELLKALGVQGSFGLPDGFFDALLGREVISPHQAVQDSLDKLATMQAAVGPAATFAAATKVAGLDIEPRVPTAQPLYPGLVELYARNGVVLGAADLADMAESVRALDADTTEGLALLVTAMNRADAARITGVEVNMAQAMADLIAAAEAAEVHFSLSAASACNIFAGPMDLVTVDGDCDNTYDTHRFLSVDTGGNDRYNNNAGGANGVGSSVLGAVSPTVDRSPLTDGVDGAEANATDPNGPNAEGAAESLVNGVSGCCAVNPGLNPAYLETFRVAVAIDMGGDDTYHSEKRYVQGSAVQAMGLLLDFSGTDSYTAGGYSQGYANTGYGVLIDVAGNDDYTSGDRSQGGESGGFLFDLGGDDTYVAGDASQGGRIVAVPTGTSISMLFDATGNDSYNATGNSQGVGNILIDGTGDDDYFVVGSSDFDQNAGFGQGSGLLTSIGLLIDGAGNDDYYADIYAAQGVAWGIGTSSLVDVSGDDTYWTSGIGQAVCSGAPETNGILFDGAGNDHYTALRGGQGLASSASCTSFLIDRSGNDHYVAASGSQGSTFATQITEINGGLLGVLADGGGNDIYEAGSFSQGAGGNGGIGLLLDADGQDQYTAGDSSQGSGGYEINVVDTVEDEFLAAIFVNPEVENVAGIANLDDEALALLPLVEETSIRDGVGVLIDGLQDFVRSTDVITTDSSGVHVDLFVATPGDNGNGDRYTAGDHSQGASGASGAIGILIDNDDESESGGGPHKGVYTSGAYSQGSASNGGFGMLFDREGNDRHVSGIFSQGASPDSGVGVLIDLAGNDEMYATPVSQSRGYAISTDLYVPAVGLNLNIGGKDMYTGWNGHSHDDLCELKGTGGLTIDLASGSIPTTCIGASASAAEATAFGVGGNTGTAAGTALDALIIALGDTAVETVDFAITTIEETIIAVLQLIEDAPGILMQTIEDTLETVDAFVNLAPAPAFVCPAGAVFCDDFEGTFAWTIANGATFSNTWRLVNQADTPQPFGPNAFSEEQYLYIGARDLPPGITYTGTNGDGILVNFLISTVTSPVITLPVGTATLDARIAGSSEADFDELVVKIIPATGTTIEERISGVQGYSPVTSINLSSLAGQDVQIQFSFITDDVVQDGQGWNIDDVVVY